MGKSTIDLKRRPKAEAQVLDVEKSQTVLIGKGTFFERFVKNSVSTSQDGLVIDAVSKA